MWWVCLYICIYRFIMQRHLVFQIILLDWHTFCFAWNCHRILPRHVSFFAYIFPSFFCRLNSKHTFLTSENLPGRLGFISLKVSYGICKHLNTKQNVKIYDIYDIYDIIKLKLIWISKIFLLDILYWKYGIDINPKTCLWISTQKSYYNK